MPDTEALTVADIEELKGVLLLLKIVPDTEALTVADIEELKGVLLLL